MEYPQEIEFFNKCGQIKINSWLPVRLSKQQISQLSTHFDESYEGKTRNFAVDANLFKPAIPNGLFVCYFGITSDKVPFEAGLTITNEDVMVLLGKVISYCALLSEYVLSHPKMTAKWLAQMRFGAADKSAEAADQATAAPSSASGQAYSPTEAEIYAMIEEAKNWQQGK